MKTFLLYKLLFISILAGSTNKNLHTGDHNQNNQFLLNENDSIKICVRTSHGEPIPDVKVSTLSRPTPFFTAKDGCVNIYNPKSDYDSIFILTKEDEFSSGVDVMDAIMAYENILDIRKFDCHQTYAGDISATSGITSLDLALYFRSIMNGINPTSDEVWKFFAKDIFPAGTPQYYNIEACEMNNPNGNNEWQPTLDFVGIKKGDIDNSHLIPYEKSFQLLMEQASNQSNNVSIKTTNDIVINAVNLELEIDTSRIKITDITSNVLKNFSYSSNILVSGNKIRVIWPSSVNNAGAFANIPRFTELFSIEYETNTQDEIYDYIQLSSAYNHSIKQKGGTAKPRGLLALREADCNLDLEIDFVHTDTIFIQSCNTLPEDIILQYIPTLIGGECADIQAYHFSEIVGVSLNRCPVHKVSYFFINWQRDLILGPFVRYFTGEFYTSSPCGLPLDVTKPTTVVKNNVVLKLSNPEKSLSAKFFDSGSYDNCTPFEKLFFTFNDQKPQISNKTVANGIINAATAHYFDATGGIMKFPTSDANTLKLYSEGKLQLWNPIENSSSMIVSCDVVDKIKKYGIVNSRLSVWDESYNLGSQPITIRIEDVINVCKDCGNEDDVIRPTPYFFNETTVLLKNGKAEVLAKDPNKGSFDNCTKNADLLYTFYNYLPQIDDKIVSNGTININTPHYFNDKGGLSAFPSLDQEILDAYENGEIQLWQPQYKSSSRIFSCEDIVQTPNLFAMVSVWDEKFNTDFAIVNFILKSNTNECDEQNKLYFYTFNQKFEKEQTYLIPFYTSNFKNGIGFQIEFGVDNCFTKDVNTVNERIKPTFAYNLFGGSGLRLVWIDGTVSGVSFEKTDPLFYLEIEAKTDGELKDWLRVENNFVSEFTDANLIVSTNLSIEVIELEETIRLEDDIINKGETYTMPLILTSDVRTNGINYSIKYDKDVLAIKKITSDYLPNFNEMAHTKVSENDINISWKSQRPIDIQLLKNNPIINIEFTAKKNSIFSNGFYNTHDEFNVISSLQNRFNKKLVTTWNGKLTTGLGKSDFDNPINIYPNPFVDHLHIANINAPINFRIYNSIGKELLSEELMNDEVLDLSDLKPGIYFLDITDEHNIRYRYKIIKLSQ